MLEKAPAQKTIYDIICKNGTVTSTALMEETRYSKQFIHEVTKKLIDKELVVYGRRSQKGRKYVNYYMPVVST